MRSTKVTSGRGPTTRRRTAVESAQNEEERRRRRITQSSQLIQPGDLLIETPAVSVKSEVDGGEVKIENGNTEDTQQFCEKDLIKKEYHIPTASLDQTQLTDIVGDVDCAPISTHQTNPCSCSDEVKILQESINGLSEKFKADLKEHHEQFEAFKNSMQLDFAQVKGQLQDMDKRIQALEEKLLVSASCTKTMEESLNAALADLADKNQWIENLNARLIHLEQARNLSESVGFVESDGVSGHMSTGIPQQQQENELVDLTVEENVLLEENNFQDAAQVAQGGSIKILSSSPLVLSLAQVETVQAFSQNKSELLATFVTKTGRDVGNDNGNQKSFPVSTNSPSNDVGENTATHRVVGYTRNSLPVSSGRFSGSSAIRRKSTAIKCSTCAKSFEATSDYLQHKVETCTPSTASNVSACDMNHTQYPVYDGREVAGTLSKICGICLKAFPSLTELIIHKGIDHPEHSTGN